MSRTEPQPYLNLLCTASRDEGDFAKRLYSTVMIRWYGCRVDSTILLRPTIPPEKTMCSLVQHTYDRPPLESSHENEIFFFLNQTKTGP